MSQVKKIGDTLPKNTTSTSSKCDFQKDIANVKIVLPVNFDISLNLKCCITLVNHQDEFLNYYFDYLPNVDVNSYIQFAIQKYQHGITSNSSVPSESL